MTVAGLDWAECSTECAAACADGAESDDYGTVLRETLAVAVSSV